MKAAIARGENPDDLRNPQSYTLGKGHVRFFYPRLGYLAARQKQLIAEMRARGYVPKFTNPDELLFGIPAEWCRDWEPTVEALAINRVRIAERLNKR